MDELGSILREAREMKGLSLGDVQEQIKINSRYLQALETGQYEQLPTPVHVRGFLRNYARFLELAPEPLLERYEARRKDQPVRVPAAVNAAANDPPPSIPDQPFFEPVNADLEGGTDSAVRLVIFVAALITILLIGARFAPRFLGEGDGQDDMSSLIQSLLAPGDDTAEPAAAPDDGESESNMPLVTSVPITSTGRNNPDGTVATGAAPTRPLLPPTLDTIHLRLDITERTWIQVTIDGEIVLEDQVTRDDGPFEWDAEQTATLKTGNAVGVVVTINDIELGRLGGRGEPAEETWQTTQQ